MTVITAHMKIISKPAHKYYNVILSEAKNLLNYETLRFTQGDKAKGSVCPLLLPG